MIIKVISRLSFAQHTNQPGLINASRNALHLGSWLIQDYPLHCVNMMIIKWIIISLDYPQLCTVFYNDQWISEQFQDYPYLSVSSSNAHSMLKWCASKANLLLNGCLLIQCKSKEHTISSQCASNKHSISIQSSSVHPTSILWETNQHTTGI